MSSEDECICCDEYCCDCKYSRFRKSCSIGGDEVQWLSSKTSPYNYYYYVETLSILGRRRFYTKHFGEAQHRYDTEKEEDQSHQVKIWKITKEFMTRHIIKIINEIDFVSKVELVFNDE
jgi:hypothetical protein